MNAKTDRRAHTFGSGRTTPHILPRDDSNHNITFDPLRPLPATSGRARGDRYFRERTHATHSGGNIVGLGAGRLR